MLQFNFVIVIGYEKSKTFRLLGVTGTNGTRARSEEEEKDEKDEEDEEEITSYSS